MNFNKFVKLDFICMKTKLMKNKSIYAEKIMKGVCTQNCNRFYVEDLQELCPFYM